MMDANGGYWQDGKTAVPLRSGAASMVFYKDGHVDVVKWSAAALDLTWLWTVRLVHMGAGRPSEAKNCTPPRAAIIGLARKDSVSFRVAKVMHVQRVAVQSPRSATVIRRIVLEHGLHSRRDFVMGDDLNLHVPTPVIAPATFGTPTGSANTEPSRPSSSQHREETVR